MAVKLLALRAGRYLQAENIQYFPHSVVEYVSQSLYEGEFVK
jgi:hypothetical protein